MFAVVGFLCLSITYVVTSKVQCSAGQQCPGAVTASMLQTHSHQSHGAMATAKAVATQSMNSTANRRDQIKAMMNKRRRADLDAIKKDIGDARDTGLQKKGEFESSELFQWVTLIKSSPLGEVATYTEEKAVYFWNQLKEALKDPIGTLKKLLEKWVPDLKAIIEEVHEKLEEAGIERFFNGRAIKSFFDGDWVTIGMDMLNLFSESKSIDGESKPGFDRYLDAIVYIHQEVEIGEIVGQILQGAVELLKEVQDAAITMVEKGLAAVEEMHGAVALGPIGQTIELFAGAIGIDMKDLAGGEEFWEDVQAKWGDAKDDFTGWWNGLTFLEKGSAVAAAWNAPTKAVLITVAWNSLAIIVDCHECYNVNGCAVQQSLAQVSNQSTCADSMRAKLTCDDDTAPAVTTSINDEGGTLNGKMHEVDHQLEVWSLKETLSSSSQSLSDFFEGVDEQQGA